MKHSNLSPDVNKKKSGEDDIFDRIIQIYYRYAEQQDNENIYLCVADDIKLLNQMTQEQKSRLRVELPIEEIERIFNENGVIQLRPLDTSTKLLIGCGNTPCNHHYHTQDEPSSHDHKEFVTINPMLSMNPSIVGAFGINKGLDMVLPKAYYTELRGEAVTIANSINEFDRSALACMTADFKTFNDINSDDESVEFANSFFFWYSDAGESDNRAILEPNSIYSRLLNLYSQYAARQTDEYISRSVLGDLKVLASMSMDEWLRLRIEIPIDEIERIYNVTGVIQLRPVDTSTKLLLGCGNGPCEKHFHSAVHEHEGMITINPELSMNPCVIAAFGKDIGLSKVLPRNFFTELHGEAVSLSTSIKDFDTSALNCMTADFKTFAGGDPDFEKSYFFWTSSDDGSSLVSDISSSKFTFFASLKMMMSSSRLDNQHHNQIKHIIQDYSQDKTIERYVNALKNLPADPNDFVKILNNVIYELRFKINPKTDGMNKYNKLIDGLMNVSFSMTQTAENIKSFTNQKG